VKNVGKPCEGEPHARIDGRELETEQTFGHGHGEEQPTRNRAVPNGSVTYHRTTPPRQLPTLLRYGVSKAVFSAVDYHAWDRLMRWIRAKYADRHRLGMTQLRRRFCDKGWRFAHNGVAFTGAASVPVTRYRYRGSKIPTPWTPQPATTTTGN
jgi:hypothetical protein